MPELPSSAVFKVSGWISVNSSADRWVAAFSGAVDGAVATVGTAPAGTPVVLDILKNGVSVYSDATQRPVIPSGATQSQVPAGKMGAAAPVGIQQTTGATFQAGVVASAGTAPAAKLPGYVNFAQGDVLVLSVVQAAPPVAAPVLSLGATSTTGGTFIAGSYFWEVTALTPSGETTGSNEVTATLSLNGSQVLNWTTPTGATGYKVYRGTAAGAENALITTLGAVSTYTDTGTAGTAATVPTTSTSSQPGANLEVSLEYNAS